MSLKEKIQSDIKEAMKARENEKVGVLRMLQSEIKNAEIAKRTKLSKSNGADDIEQKSQLSDEEIIEVISRETKKRKDAIELYEKGGRKELAEKEKKEAEILSAYMPEQMSEEEIRSLAKKTIDRLNASGQQDMGKVMGALKLETKGKADGAAVSRIVKELLSL